MPSRSLHDHQGLKEEFLPRLIFAKIAIRLQRGDTENMITCVLLWLVEAGHMR